MIHHDMYRRKQLKLSKKEFPEVSAPINIDKNTELQYFMDLGSQENIVNVLNKKKINLDFRFAKR